MQSVFFTQPLCGAVLHEWLIQKLCIYEKWHIYLHIESLLQEKLLKQVAQRAKQTSGVDAALKLPQMYQHSGITEGRHVLFKPVSCSFLSAVYQREV